MKTIKIYFVQPGVDGYACKSLLPILQRYYNVVLDDRNPDYVIYSVQPCIRKVKTVFDYPNAVKIFFTGENLTPDFNIADYALGFHNIEFTDRYLRLPLWYLYLLDHNKMEYIQGQNINDNFAKRKFCNFIYSNSNNANKMREESFHKMSEYKKVDAAGKMLNNIGARVEDKMAFIHDYKFTLAIENSYVDGYVTEKIIEPKIMGSIPIYWGSKHAVKDFNPKAFVNVNDFESLDKLKEYVEYLDNNDEQYLEMLREPMFIGDSLMVREIELKKFLDNIFNAEPQKARRNIPEGYITYHVKHQTILAKIQQLPGYQIFWRLIARYYKIK